MENQKRKKERKKERFSVKAHLPIATNYKNCIGIKKNKNLDFFFFFKFTQKNL